jgi:hypothetical protein
MNNLPQPPARNHIWRPVCVLAALTLLAGCARGEFGEIYSGWVTDGIHDWVGRDSNTKPPIPPSAFEYTDDERALRDLAYPLIEPPYDRQKWYSVAGEYGLIRYNIADYQKYYDRLMSTYQRSSAGRYAQLIDDIRNDATRLAQFFETAGRVLDIDQKRQKSLQYVSALNKAERQNALRRVRENAHVVDIVRHSLADRAAAYHFALERLVITIPSTQAVESERLLTGLDYQIARYDTLLPPTWQREPSLAKSN